MIDHDVDNNNNHHFRWIDKEAKENVANEDGLGLRDGEFDLGMYHTLKEVSIWIYVLHESICHIVTIDSSIRCRYGDWNFWTIQLLKVHL